VGFFEIERLQIAANIEKDIPVVRSERLNLDTGAEMIIDSIALSRPRSAGITKDQWLKSGKQLRMELAECFSKRTLPDARWTTQHD
jgi:hypothetical protein